MSNPTPTATAHETSGLFVAFVATAALVLGIVCRTAIVDTLAAVTPPALDSIVLPFAAPRTDVATAPPASPANPNATASASAPTTVPVAPGVRTAATATRRVTVGARLPSVATISTVLAAATAPLPPVAATATTLPSTAGEMTRSLAGTTVDLSTLTSTTVPRTARVNAHASATANRPAPHVDRAQQAPNGAHRHHPQHPDGGRRSGR
jgi:hypothetical protein